jgi:hypothetical protein
VRRITVKEFPNHAVTPPPVGSIAQQGFIRMYKRLAAYEDTGLTPDEVAELKAENARLQRERDALMWEIRGVCRLCRRAMCGVACNEHRDFVGQTIIAGCKDFDWRGPREDAE